MLTLRSAVIRRCLSLLLLLGFLGVWASPATVAQEARLLRFPAIHGNQLVFCYGGDLYTVTTDGGLARRLTTDVGYEMFPRFSPDGKWLAFTAQYDGNTEAYLMPALGGKPLRLTYTATLSRDDVSDRMGPNNIVMTWRDNDTILFRSRKIEWNDFNGQLMLVSTNGGLPEQLPLPRGGWCAFSPDKKKLAYNRVFREFRTWKRYRGGQADDIWIYDFEAKTLENITKDPAQDIHPMWHGDKIYFASDRDDLKRMNLYAYDLKKKTTTKLTSFTEYDVKFPSLGDKAIAFENGGYLYLLDLATEKVRKVPVQIAEDLAMGRGGLKDVSKEVSNFDISPDGSRALFGARGDVFTVPAKHGNTRNLTKSPGVHERNAVWSPDGRSIAYVSDRSGEDEIYVEPQDGRGETIQLTSNADTYKYSILWSPDSKRILWADKKLRLQFVTVETKEVTLVDQATDWEFSDYSWAPDSKWIVYARPEDKEPTRLALYSLETKQWKHITDAWFSSHEPIFSADGKMIFFVSERDFSPRFSHVEANHAYFDMSRIYFLTLAADTKSPFEPRSDEVKIKKDEKKDDKATAVKEKAKDSDKTEKATLADSDKKKDVEADKSKDAGKDATKDTDKDKSKDEAGTAVKVDWDGIGQRIGVLPVPPSGYSGLAAVGERLYYTRHGLRDERGRMFMFELDKDKLKETELGEVSGYALAADGKKMLIHANDGGYGIIDVPTGRIEIKDRLDLSDLKVDLDRRAEWSQIYKECWRQMRDFMFDPNLHKVDWARMRERYEPLVAHVQHRADLTYVIGELIAELNIGHAYVGGGDYPKAERIPLGLLGARLERDPASGALRIGRILQGQNWDRRLRSPLTEIGVTAHEGDFILAIDDAPVAAMNNPYAALIDRAGKQVRLKLAKQPKDEATWETTVIPTADERPLYYLNWVQKNIDRVSQATTNRIGYVHIPDMGEPGLNEFVKYYYPQTRKEGLIVDARYNGGGFVSPQIIERLKRELSMITIARNGAINLDPSGVVLGPKILLINEFSASDGDIVAYRFKKAQLGPVIGKRSWGGVVGIRGSLPLLDGGYMNRPEFSRYDVDGKEWIMEGKGVEPDITIDNDPTREFAGTDDQLEKAIAMELEALQKNPVKLPPPPPYPDKSK